MRKQDANESDEEEGAAASSSESSDEETRKKAADIDFNYASSNAAESSGPRDLGATARLEIDTAHDVDYQAQFERVQKALKDEPSTSAGGQKVRDL